MQVEVNGPDTHPVFKFLKDHTPLGHGGGADIEWNFAKWVVNKKGYPVVSCWPPSNLPQVEPSPAVPLVPIPCLLHAVRYPLHAAQQCVRTDKHASAYLPGYHVPHARRGCLRPLR